MPLNNILDNYKLVVLSNKYPDRAQFTKKAGGLEDTLLGYMLSEDPQQPKGTWIGAVTNVKEEPLKTTRFLDGFLYQKGVYLDDGLHESHYLRACNEGDWVESHLNGWNIESLNNFFEKEKNNLSHLQRFIKPNLDGSKPCYLPDPSYDFDSHRDYYLVNNKFAESAFEEISNDVVYWIHDYHLRLVAKALRRLMKSDNIEAPIGYFHHIPVPSYNSVKSQIENNPIAMKIFDDKLEAFLYNDAVGFHTSDYVENLMESYRARTESDNLKNRVSDMVKVAEGIYKIEHDFTDRGYTYFFAKPIAVNSSQIINAAKRKGPINFELEGGHSLESILKDCEKHAIPVFLGFDRADMTKGFYERFFIFDQMYRQGKPFVAISFAVTTRTGIPSYDRYEILTHQMARSINNFHRINKTEGLNRIFDLGLSPLYVEQNKITPPMIHRLRRRGNEGAFSIRDGQHIGPLQHIIANSLNPGKNFTMVSEDCGVYQQLKKFAQTDRHGVVGLNMFDIEGSAKKIIEAMENPKNRHSKEVAEFITNQDIKSFIEYNIGFIVAAHEDRVMEFLSSQNN